jgi:hypothetical protein
MKPKIQSDLKDSVKLVTTKVVTETTEITVTWKALRMLVSKETGFDLENGGVQGSLDWDSERSGNPDDTDVIARFMLTTQEQE